MSAAGVTDEMIACLRALAVNDGSADADRARQAIQKLGGEGTPEEAKQWIASLGESDVAPPREAVQTSIAVMRGERIGDRVLARRTLQRAGLDADRFGSAGDQKAIADLRDRMHTTREQTVHWDPTMRTTLCFPAISREEATRRIKARGDTDRGPAAIPTRELLVCAGKPWRDQ